MRISARCSRSDERLHPPDSLGRSQPPIPEIPRLNPDRASARRRARMSAVARNQQNGGARPDRALPGTQDSCPSANAEATLHRFRAAQWFHVKHRTRQQTSQACRSAADPASPRRTQADFRAEIFLTCAASNMSAAGVIPSIRDACARVAGLRASSFWRISLESPEIRP